MKQIKIAGQTHTPKPQQAITEPIPDPQGPTNGEPIKDATNIEERFIASKKVTNAV